MINKCEKCGQKYNTETPGATTTHGPTCSQSPAKKKHESLFDDVLKGSVDSGIKKISSADKKMYKRKIEYSKKEIVRLRSNYIRSLKGNYQNLDHDLQQVLNNIREASDYLAHLIYEKYVGEIPDKSRLYLNSKYNLKSELVSSVKNQEGQDLINDLYSKIDQDKLSVIFDIQDKGKHRKPHSISHNLQSNIFMDEVFVDTIYHQPQFSLRRCQFNSVNIMLKHDYSMEELIIAALRTVIGDLKPENVLEVRYKNIQGNLIGITQNPHNHNSFVKVMNPVDKKLYDLEDLLKVSEQTLTEYENIVLTKL